MDTAKTKQLLLLCLNTTTTLQLTNEVMPSQTSTTSHSPFCGPKNEKINIFYFKLLKVNVFRYILQTNDFGRFESIGQEPNIKQIEQNNPSNRYRYRYICI